MFSVKSMMRSACVAGGVAVLLGSGASAAVAAPAVFSATGGTSATPSAASPISMSWGAAPWQNRTCVSVGSGYGTTSNTGGQGSLSNLSLPQGSLTCTDGLGASFQTTITASGPALASVNAGSYSLTSPRLQIRDVGFGPGLIPATTAVSFSAPYTNGTTGSTGADPSKWTISNTVVGYVIDMKYGGGTVPLRLSVSLKTGTNVPLTLS